MAGIGIDIIEIDRIEKALRRHPRFLSRVFTPAEREYCLKRSRPAASLAARFAAKEAVVKALDGRYKGCSYRDIEITSGTSGCPGVVLHGKVGTLAADLGIETITVSFSHSREYALAVAITGENRNQG